MRWTGVMAAARGTAGMTPARWAIVAWLLLCAAQTARYVPVWRSDPALWTHAAAAAPNHPHAQINYAKVLIAAGDRARGTAVAARGLAIEQRRHDARARMAGRR